MRPPCAMLSIMSLSALGLPDISRPTSNPSFIPSSAWTSGSFSRETSTPRVAPILRARARRSGFTSVTTILRAPQWRAIAVAMQPMGPAPVISTSSPTRSNWSAVWVALPRGSKQERTSSGMAGSTGTALRRRDAEVLRERAGPVDADALRVLAEVPAAREAVAADAADDVALAVDQVALLEALDGGAHLLDHPDELVADDHRRLDGLLGPVVPVVDVDVGAADRGLLDPDQDVVRARHRHGDLGQLEARAGPHLGKGFHRLRGLILGAQQVAPDALQNNPEARIGRHLRGCIPRGRPMLSVPPR